MSRQSNSGFDHKVSNYKMEEKHIFYLDLFSKADDSIQYKYHIRIK